MKKSTIAPSPIEQVARNVERMARFAGRFIRRTTKPPGTSPGTLVPAEKRKIGKPRITVIAYNPENLQERQVGDIGEVFPLEDSSSIAWINVDGLHDVELLQKIGAHLDIHPLTLEDILNTGHRPKAELFDDHFFVVFKMLYYDPGQRHIEAEQVSLIVGKSYLLSFQEVVGDVFAPVRERLQKGKGRIRKSGSDYLAYALIDAVVDHYFIVLEKFGDKIEVLEEELLAEAGSSGLQQLYDMKREIIFFRKQVWPIRELLNRLVKEETGLIDDSVHIFFNDVYDHTIQIIDTLESFRDVLTGLMDLHLSTVGNRMNEIMKVLTIIATIFIPLTFIAGIYGMNFEFMPELRWRWSYPVLWLVLIVAFAGMVCYFRRKKWL